MGSWLMLVAVILSTVHTVASQQSVLSPNIGSCPPLSNDSGIFGSRTSFSNTGLVSTLFITGDGAIPLTLRILRVHQLCEVAGLKRNTASSVAFIVEFQNQDSSTETIVLAVDCISDPNNSNVEFSFFPSPPDPVRQTSDLNTARSSLTNTLIIPPLPSTFSTPINRTCGQCGNLGGIFANLETRCVFCDQSCNEGMRRCVGRNPNQCCNWFLNDICQVTCPYPLVGNNVTFDCGCAPLSVNNGEVMYSNNQLIGSVATYSCDEARGYELPRGSSATRTCTMTGWTGADLRCEEILMFDECPSDVAKQIMIENIITSLSSEFGVSLVGLTRSQAASSCEEILQSHPSGQGFLYWINDGNVTEQQYC